jgi:zinc transport system substrate-binding protein
MQRLVANHPGKPLFVAQPVYQYFARRYELRLQSLSWDPQTLPAEQAWEQLALAQEDFPAAWMIWEEQPSDEIRQRLQSLGIGVVVFDTCANRPQQADFMDVMKRNLENLEAVFAGSRR